MSGKFLTNLSAKVRAELKQNLKNNAVYKRHRWSLPERAQVYCSTHYLRAMLFLWTAAAGAVIAAEYFRPVFHAVAVTYLKGVTELPAWMSNLLGAQLTIIGIVFPLVVGLISVLFQKKSSRIHIQSAYQLHSGYMFAGLSGLSLAAFIVIGGLFSSAGDKYRTTAFAITALVWMLFNLGLSIWFFISSLNILDDKKRDRLMLKYFQSEIVENFILRSLINAWLQHPGNYLDRNHIKGIEILRGYVSVEEKMQLLPYYIGEGKDIIDVRLRPLSFLLRFLRPFKNSVGELILLPSLGRKQDTITLIASSDVIFPRGWAFLFRQCFIRGPKKNWKEYRYITRDFYGEAYDALEDRNISSFIIAADRLVETYTTLKKSFQYADGNYLDKCGDNGFMLTFSQSFHRDLYAFSHTTVKSLETTGEYFRHVMTIPFSVYRDSDSWQQGDFEQYVKSLFHVWHALIDWKTGYGNNLTVAQELRYRELVKDFIGEWESWFMWRRLQNRAGEQSDSDRNCLLAHLFHTAQIVITAVMKDDRFASEHSSDMLLLWYGRNNFEEHFEYYRWHSFLFTPALLTQKSDGSDWQAVLRGHEYSASKTLATVFYNAHADVRLLTAGYILSHIRQKKNVPLKDVVRRLLNSDLVYPTGAHDRLTFSFKSATDIIDSIIRLEHRNNGREDGWYGMLTGLIRTFSSFSDTETIAGRIYIGTYEDVRDIYGSYADIAFYLSGGPLTVSRRVQDALDENIFTYYTKQQIISRLHGMKRREDTSSDGYLMPEKDFKEKINSFNTTLDAYIQAFSLSMQDELIHAEVDTERLRNTDLTLTHGLPDMLAQDALLSRFSFNSIESRDTAWEARSVCGTMPKNIIARGINSNVYGELTGLQEVKNYLLHDVYRILSHLPPQRIENVRNVDELLQHVRDMTADNDGFTLIFFGTRLGSELRELTYHADRHAELGITVDLTSPPGGLMPVRINGCVVYQVWGYKGCYSLLVRNSTFGNLHLRRDPDGLLFSSSWRTNSEDPMTGSVTTTWNQMLEINGAVVARFEHL
ncbi:hypothetical protein [Edwardsiella tarda]|uniref:hypothetical protein n=1 Tax=Edwardsiella tarda TaxID=636 RepID=UPI000D518D00|nr:hypothetical protein DCF76_16785 [Edwardsiella tarda]